MVDPDRSLLSGWVEVDGTLIPYRTRQDSIAGSKGRSHDGRMAIVAAVGLGEVSDHAIDVPTVFRDFDDYWSPFLGGQGPAPGYCVSLPEAKREALRDRLRAKLPASPDGSIRLMARAFAIRGVRPA